MKYFMLIAFIAVTVYSAEKKSVAVNTLKPRGVDSTTALVLTDYLSSYMHETGEYKVMERATMDAILTEQQFQSSGACDDQACMVEMGQLLGVSFIVAGTVSKLGSKYIIQARLIDVKTGEILQFEKGECTSIEDQLDSSVKKIAYSFSGKKMAKKEVKEEKKSNTMLYLGIGGLALAGGGVAYFLLAGGEEETPPGQDQTNAKFGDFPAAPQF